MKKGYKDIDQEKLKGIGLAKKGKKSIKKGYEKIPKKKKEKA